MGFENILKSVANHPIRHMAQNMALMLPGTRSIQERISTSTGANGKENYEQLMCGWARQVADVARMAGIDIAGAKLAEVGPGHSLGVAVALLLTGAAEVSALDVRQCVDPTNPEPFRPIAEYYRKQSGVHDRADLKRVLPRLKYAIVLDDGSWPVQDNSVDVLYSYFAGEHLRAPREVLAETHRVLRPGGICIYAIDLRDHFNNSGNWLKFRYYESWVWEAMSSRRGKWSNRIVAPQWRTLFEEKFEIVTFHEGRKPPPADFDRSRLASTYQQYDTETLAVDYLWVVGRKG